MKAIDALNALWGLRGTHYILDEDGDPKPVDFSEWAAWFGTANRAVKQEQVGKYFISTVFLGLDHQFGDGPPLLFETMVFPGTEPGLDIACERYSTRAEALAGHEAMVKRYKKNARSRTKD